MRGGEALHRADVVLVHTENEIETVEIPHIDLARPLLRNIDSVQGGDVNRTAVRRITLMPGAKPGRIDRITAHLPVLFKQVQKNSLGKRGTAYIASAYKQD